MAFWPVGLRVSSACQRRCHPGHPRLHQSPNHPLPQPSHRSFPALPVRRQAGSQISEISSSRHTAIQTRSDDSLACSITLPIHSVNISPHFLTRHFSHFILWYLFDLVLQGLHLRICSLDLLLDVFECFLSVSCFGLSRQDKLRNRDRLPLCLVSGKPCLPSPV